MNPTAAPSDLANNKRGAFLIDSTVGVWILDSILRAATTRTASAANKFPCPMTRAADVFRAKYAAQYTLLHPSRRIPQRQRLAERFKDHYLSCMRRLNGIKGQAQVLDEELTLAQKIRDRYPQQAAALDRSGDDKGSVVRYSKGRDPRISKADADGGNHDSANKRQL